MAFESARVLQSREGILPAIQYLRGIAAAMVVLGHCYLYAAFRDPHLAVAPVLEAFGQLGVAIFFIISGFIMYFTCRFTWDGSRASAWGFVSRRLHRIVPLYWLLTSVMLALVLIGSADDGSSKFGLREILLSYLFVPFDFDGMKFRPILAVGWTLDFEMFFYALFTIGLFQPKRRGLPLVLALIVFFIALGQAGVLGHSALGAWAQPIIALFGLGILLGWARDRIDLRLDQTTGGAVLVLLMALSPVALWLSPVSATQLMPNVPIWAFSLLCVAVGAFTAAGHQDRPSPISRAGLLLGDASYLLYLVHPIVVLVLAQIAKRLHVHAPAALIATAAVMFAASIAVALVGHVQVERRLARWTAPLFGRAKRKPVPVAEVPETAA